MSMVDLVVLNFYFDLIQLFYFPEWNRYFSACKSLPNSSCYFWIHKSVLHQSSVPSNTTPLYFFTSNIIYFGQKHPTKEQVFEIFKCPDKNLSNSSCHFPYHKLVFLQILHHSSVSWDITSLYFFSWNCIFFQQKESIKVQIWWNVTWAVKS